MDFEALVGLLQNPGDAVVPPTIYDDIRSQYNGLSENFSSAQAKINELTESNSVLSDQLSKMKAANYDLLTQVQGKSAESEGDDGSDGSDDSDADDGDDGSIDAFFDKRVEDEKE
jgi:hypothetical protein